MSYQHSRVYRKRHNLLRNHKHEHTLLESFCLAMKPCKKHQRVELTKYPLCVVHFSTHNYRNWQVSQWDLLASYHLTFTISRLNLVCMYGFFVMILCADAHVTLASNRMWQPSEIIFYDEVCKLAMHLPFRHNNQHQTTGKHSASIQ